MERDDQFTQEDLHRFQREVSRVVMKITVTDENGGHIFLMKADTHHDGGDDVSIATLSKLILDLVDQWESIHGRILGHLRKDCFGHLTEEQCEMIDAVLVIGTLLFNGLQKLREDSKETVMADKIIDLAAALRAMRFIQASYEENPSNEDLEALAKSA